MSGFLEWHFDPDVGEHQDLLHRRVREAYLAAYSVLLRAHQESKEQLLHDLATDQSESELISQMIDYEDERWMEQTAALAAMALTLLGSLNKSLLDRWKSRMNKTHPRDPKGYDAKSCLLRQVAEFKIRFGVDLEKIAGFETVREVELARNCCVHNEGVPNADYEGQTKQRLLDERSNINMTPDQLDLFIKELSDFANSLCDRMREVRRSSSTAAHKG